MHALVQLFKDNWKLRLIEIISAICAVTVAFFIAQSKFSLIGVAILAIVGITLYRYALKEPFYKTLMIYLSLVAFNYYYFYCAALTGRNPTHIPEMGGQMATPFEQIQKDILFAVILSIAFIKLVDLKFQDKQILWKRLNNPLMKVVMVWVGFSIFRTFFIVFEGDTNFNIFHYLRNNIEFATIPFLLATSLITKEKHLNVILKGIFYTIPIVSMLGIIEFFIHGSPFVKTFYGGDLIYRATATMQNPNNLGAYLATTMGVYVIYYLRRGLHYREKLMFWPTMILGMACLFMTLSRSSWIFAFIALTLTMSIVLFVTKAEKGEKWDVFYQRSLILYGVVVTGAIYFLFRYFDLSNAIQDAGELYLGYNKLSLARTYAVNAAMDYLLSHPEGLILGFSKESLTAVPDNAYAEVLVRSGLIGFTLYISIWFLCFKNTIKGMLDKTVTHPLYFSCFYILAFQAMYAFSHPVQRNFPHNLYFWFVVGTVIWLSSRFVRRDLNPDEVENKVVPLRHEEQSVLEMLSKPSKTQTKR